LGVNGGGIFTGLGVFGGIGKNLKKPEKS